MIDPANDVWVWATAAVFLVLMGARAWVVETGRTRPGRTSRQVTLLTGACAVALVGLVALLGVQGGGLMVSSVVNGTNPSTAFYGPAPVAPEAPHPATGG